MPWRLKYELTMKGRLRGDVTANKNSVQAFRDAFSTKSGGQPWGDDFVPAGFTTCQWIADGFAVAASPNTANQPTTELLFHAEFSRTYPLDTSPEEILAGISKYYKYRTSAWYGRLYEALWKFNKTYEKELLDDVRVCAWQEYCGNGGP